MLNVYSSPLTKVSLIAQCKPVTTNRAAFVFQLIHYLALSHHDSRRGVTSTDIHCDVIILRKVDAFLIVGENGCFIFGECFRNIRDPWSCSTKLNYLWFRKQTTFIIMQNTLISGHLLTFFFTIFLFWIFRIACVRLRCQSHHRHFQFPTKLVKIIKTLITTSSKGILISPSVA